MYVAGVGSLGGPAPLHASGTPAVVPRINLPPGGGSPDGGGGGGDGDKPDEKGKDSDVGRRRRRRAHRVATIPREGGTVAVVAATMMTPMIPRRAVIRPCLS